MFISFKHQRCFPNTLGSYKRISHQSTHCPLQKKRCIYDNITNEDMFTMDIGINLLANFVEFSKPLITKVFQKLLRRSATFSWRTVISTILEYFVVISSTWAFAYRCIINGGMHIIHNSNCLSHEAVKMQPVLTLVAFIKFKLWGEQLTDLIKDTTTTYWST